MIRKNYKSTVLKSMFYCYCLNLGLSGGSWFFLLWHPLYFYFQFRKILPLSSIKNVTLFYTNTNLCLLTLPHDNRLCDKLPLEIWSLYNVLYSYFKFLRHIKCNILNNIKKETLYIKLTLFFIVTTTTTKTSTPHI